MLLSLGKFERDSVINFFSNGTVLMIIEYTSGFVFLFFAAPKK